MSLFNIASAQLNSLLWLVLSNFVLGWGVFRFVPDTLNAYGFDYFGWKRFKRQGIIGGLAIVATANGIIAAFLKLPAHALPMWASLCLALILVSCIGIWRLDRAFQIIPDRFHTIGFIGASGYLAAGIYASPASLSTYIFGVIAGLLLPVSLLGINFLYSKFRTVDGLGLGDVKALLWLPLAIGDKIWIAFAGACILAGFVQGTKMLFRRKIDLQSPFAFGPYIVICVVASLLSKSLQQ